MMEFKDDLDIILKTMDISLRDIAEELGFDAPTVSNWLTGKKMPDKRSMEDIYGFAYKHGLFINRAHEKPLLDLSVKDDFKLLYHGSKNGIKGEINIDISKKNNDFGKGFYLGESLEQSVTFVSDQHDAHIYSYGLYEKELNIYRFEVNLEWMLTIAYYRGRLEQYSDSRKLKEIIQKSKNADVIVAPIADNRMFRIIDEYVEGQITDQACMNAIAALNLGNQYVIKTEKALKKLGFIRELYICEDERKFYQNRKTIINRERSESIRNFRSKYREGKYIEEIL